MVKDMNSFLEQVQTGEAFLPELEQLTYSGQEQPVQVMVSIPEQASTSSNPATDLTQTLQNLEQGITSIRTSLDKPKEKRVNLREMNRKIDTILEILNSWSTT